MPQSYASILLHLVFSTKNREPLISPTIEPELFAYLGAVMKTNGSPALAINGSLDHVHILTSFCRTKSVAEVIEELKTDSSAWIKTKGKEFSQFYWQTGYGAFSIGRSNVGSLKSYIARQKTHHKKVTFQDEFRKLLRLYEIEFDERYIWK